MTPLTGVGVNLAMHDAYDLASAIENVVVNGASIDSALEEYERRMFARATENVEGTRHSQALFFSGLEVQEVIQKLLRVFSGED